MKNGIITTAGRGRSTALAAVLCLFALALITSPAGAAATETITITISIDDTGMATSTITSPTDGFAYSTDSITIEGTAASTNGIVADVQVSIDGGPWISAVDTGTNFDTWQYATGTLTAGAHTVVSRAINEYDTTGASSPIVNFTTTSDSTPPDQIATVNDGPGADIDYASSTTALSANWSASADAGSGLAAYYYSIGTTSGASDVVGWTFVATASTSVTKSALSLSDAQAYYFSVKAEDGVGLFSTPTVSDGILVDSIAPVITDNQSGDDTVRAANIALYDVDLTDSGGSLLEKFQVRACATNANCGDIAGWTDVTNAMATGNYTADWSLPAAVWSALPGGTSYISLRAYDAAENSAESGPLFYVIKDTTAPTFGGITSAADTMQGGRLLLSWSAAADSTPPITYNIYTATTSGAQNFASPPYATTSATSTFITGLTNSQVYYTVVRAEDSVENEDANTVELATTPTCVPDLAISQSVSDIQLSGTSTSAIPGAMILYSVYYENSPSLCFASNAVITGYAPANTDYASGTIKLNGVSKTDTAGDGCEFKTAPGRVECTITNLPASSTGTMEFNTIIR